MPVVHGTGKCDASAVNHRARTEIRTNDPPALITPHPLPAGPIDPILTIGHSNHGMERFLELLHRHQVRTFIDVRTVPHSVRTEIQPRQPHPAVVRRRHRLRASQPDAV